MMWNAICKNCSNDGAGCLLVQAVVGEINAADLEARIFTDDITGCVVDCDAYQCKEDK